MKHKIKLIPAIILVGIVMATTSIAQNITGSGANNFVLKFTSTGSTAGNSLIYDNGSNVSIGVGGLDVDDYINAGAANGSAAYYIWGSKVLWYKGHTQNIFVGVGAGASTTGYYNTFTGNNAGFSNTGGSNHTFIGNSAGYYNGTGDVESICNNNTFVGSSAGYNNTIGGHNIFLGGSAGSSNTTAFENVALGYQALNTQSYNNGGTGGWSSYNVAVGNNALYANQPTSTSNGINNTAIGHNAGSSNTTGLRNCYFGSNAGYSNQTGNYNVYMGYYTGYYTTGSYNVCIGDVSGSASSATFSGSTFVGQQAGHLTTTGINNCFLGYSAGYNNTTGPNNVIMGYNAGKNFANEWNCTFIGYGTDANANNLTNATAIGNGAIAMTSNYLQLGNANTTIVHGAVNYTWSDARIKNNVKEDVKGLEFINKLRPITYQLDTKKITEMNTKNMPDSTRNHFFDGVDFSGSSSIIHTGFIAQEVVTALKDCNYTSDIVHIPSDSSTDTYALSYAQMVVPLVKAVQELSHTVDSLLTVSKNSLRTTGSNNTPPSTDVELASKSAILYQNMPNPFGDGTVVKYFVPENSIGASIIFFDEFGNEIKNMELPNRGVTAELNLATMNLATGIYSYSMLVNGKVVDTKKMIKSK